MELVGVGWRCVSFLLPYLLIRVCKHIKQPIEEDWQVLQQIDIWDRIKRREPADEKLPCEKGGLRRGVMMG